MNRLAAFAAALIQGTLGLEFVLSGLDKFADPHYVADFGQFVRVNPGAINGPASILVKAFVLPHLTIASVAVLVVEVSLGFLLLIGAIDLGWRGFFEHRLWRSGYQAAAALTSAVSGIGVAGLSLSIALLMGEQLPTVMSVNAFTTAIPVELLLVPVGIGVALIGVGRFTALRIHSRTHGEWLRRRTA
ncbi:MAG TPA: hypothetical protein VFR68_09965 [Candidatus Dormibacteraeota bacterium]|nr:hypothetical protein [Candidatus Dormibacteraeota bacterium]